MSDIFKPERVILKTIKSPPQIFIQNLQDKKWNQLVI